MSPKWSDISEGRRVDARGQVRRLLMQVHKDGHKIWLFTRDGQDWTDRFPQLASGTGGSRGEGRRRVCRREDGLALWAFDLLYADGKDIRYVPASRVRPGSRAS